jgi:hypothetical protein
MKHARWRWYPQLLVAMAFLVCQIILGSCVGNTASQGARERVVEMIESGELHVPEGLTRISLPRELVHASSGGTIMTLREPDSLAIVFFDFRGLNHYTGWVYTTAALTEDPLSNRPFRATPIGDNWYRVEAG